MARRRRSTFVRPPERTKMWIGIGVGISTITGNAAQLLAVLNAGALALRPFTVLRTHLDILFGSDQNAATERAQAALGLTVVTDVASAIGVTAVPDPSSISGDPDADWFAWQSFANFLLVGSSVGFVNDGEPYTIDSKAMRKVGPNDDMVMVSSSDTAVGAFLATQGRMLIQLH